MMFFNYKDISMYYEISGNHPKSIVILPGWGDTRKTFDYLINYLSEYFTVYIVDYPGFGNSKFPNNNLTIFDYSELIYEFIKYLNLDDPILIGHSFGGRIITVLAGYYCYDFSNIILIDSAGIKPKKTIKSFVRSWSYKILRKLGKLIPKKYRKKYYKLLFSHYASADYQNLNQCMRETFKNIVNTDLKNYLNHINSRVLIIWGNDDKATPVKDAIVINKKIKNSELIIIDKTGHFPYLEKPQLINSILYEQLKEEIQ